MSANIVKLNVGGVKYYTTRSTVSKYQDSMLGAMFNENHILSNVDENGYYFIDRNGKLFEHVLEFLRCGELVLSTNFNDLERLKKEAEFYQIQPLIEAVSTSTFTSPEELLLIIFYYKNSSDKNCEAFILCKKINGLYKPFHRYDYRGLSDEEEFLESVIKMQENELLESGWILNWKRDLTNEKMATFIMETGFTEDPVLKDFNHHPFCFKVFYFTK